jgi:AsmA protein
MKALRILGIAVGVLLALIAVGVGTLFALFDGEKVKAEASRAVLEKYQRKLDIAGNLNRRVWRWR